MARILIIDDDAAFLATLQATLRSLGHSVVALDNGAAGVAQLREGGVDMAFVDFRMPGMDGIAVLRARQDHATARQVPLVMLTAYASSSNTIEAMTLGAFDHLVKPVGRAEIVEVVQRALHSAADAPEPGAASLAPAEEADALIGHSPAMRTVHKRIGLAAGAELPVLITGETGTGKELAARALHRASARAQRAFVAVNCAAIPLELMESELFGHRKGAFSGATSDRIGLIRQADGGSLFLDEIGDMPLPMQGKLLRFLQEGEVTPLGGNGAQKVDVRVLAATHRDLAAWASTGQFRSDLRYRLNVVPIELPPLRERGDDILLLATHFLQSAGGAARALSPDAQRRVLDHPWPGNVRELRNVMQRCALLVRGHTIAAGDLDEALGEPLPGDPLQSQPADAPTGTQSLPEAVAQLEKRMIQAALTQAQGNRAEAARQLGIHRQLLYRKLDDYGLQ
ncbi:sigma-54 dependent transcriptional regulator [Xanthomonas campestris pv. campestris]|uniref:sigma-54-dependent transcriptional regulator n=1 Tax=Xanthomonas campestris TaxID=339 RepID=UPI0008397426|nr:sigma-54 dependent transcriptional regulator [Xanthomonas campestris]MCD0254532.1 sigma-54-dependent Fis family transcriptional regulator [Xanthomonas campestris pv. campestris]MCF8792864.1 sigma-54-dependent Fis family transcriptional regulator [Xanthomonas campestris pv. campestris]MCF8869573.1 sigma-54-dependent Fis family transcriptional regulator [Xanthomonas campestris pv. campestris]MCF8872065.1 sigma-54-dependent Fis family transcriptional regulator [Xanthomonas campestris pv. campes